MNWICKNDPLHPKCIISNNLPKYCLYDPGHMNCNPKIKEINRIQEIDDNRNILIFIIPFIYFIYLLYIIIKSPFQIQKEINIKEIEKNKIKEENIQLEKEIEIIKIKQNEEIPILFDKDLLESKIKLNLFMKSNEITKEMEYQYLQKEIDREMKIKLKEKELKEIKKMQNQKLEIELLKYLELKRTNDLKLEEIEIELQKRKEKEIENLKKMDQDLYYQIIHYYFYFIFIQLILFISIYFYSKIQNFIENNFCFFYYFCIPFKYLFISFIIISFTQYFYITLFLSVLFLIYYQIFNYLVFNIILFFLEWIYIHYFYKSKSLLFQLFIIGIYFTISLAFSGEFNPFLWNIKFYL